MPLILCTVFFIVLFSCEGFLEAIEIDLDKQRLKRYEQVEHPRANRSDSYLDADWS